MSETTTSLVDSLYAEAREAVKSCAALLDSFSKLILILGNIKSEERLCTHSKSEFFKWFQKVLSLNVIQYVEFCW